VSQTLDLIMSAKNSTDAAFKQLQSGLGGTEAQLKKLVPATDAWSTAQQRAAMRMENLHEEALKMNTGLGTTDDKAQRLSSTINTMSSTLTSSAAAMGMPIGQLGALNSAADIAGMGMGKLKTSTVGFNTASIAVAGAALAVGLAVGGWLRTFPAVSKVADDAAAGLVRLFTAQKDLDAQANATQGLAKFRAEMAASHEAALKRQVETMRAAGATEQQILDMLKGKHKEKASSVVEGIEKQIQAEKKAAAESKKLAEDTIEQWKKMGESISNARVTGTVFATAMPNAIRPAQAAVIDLRGLVVDLGAKSKASLEQQKKDWEELDKAIAAAILTASNDKAWDMVEAAENGLAASAEEARNLADALDAVIGLLDLFGIEADSATGQLIAGLAGAAEGAANLMAGLASGNPASIIAGITGIASAIKGLISSESGLNRLIGGAMVAGPIGAIGALLFGGGGPTAAQRLQHDIMVMRTEFINAAGGLNVLQENAAKAGVSLDAMWNARTVAEYEAAVKRVNDAIALHESAVDKTKAAMERWGLTAADMGPQFAQGMLHESLAQIWGDLQLLEVGGANVAAVLAGPMGDAIQTMVQQAQASGAALPEFMRPYIQTLIDAGDLIDANGNAITSTSQLNFTADLSAQVQLLVEDIRKLVAALNGIPPEVETLVKVTTQQNGNGPPFPGGADGDPETPYPMAEGGWFPYRPGGYGPLTVGEQSDEAIIPADKLAGIVAKAAAMAGGGHGGAGGTTVVHNHFILDGRELRGWFLRQEHAGMLAGTQ
jgi:hypothetical protein